MSKFLIKASYTAEGVRGLLKEGGSARRAAIQKAVEGVGGKLETFYFTYGPDDALVIADIPDATAAMALSLATSASGVVRVSTVPLISPEEMDAASKRSVAYRAPGA